MESTRDSSGLTPLHLAVWNMHSLFVKALLSHDTTITRTLVSSRDEDGVTALHFAVWNNDVQIMKWLLDAKADPNAPTREGSTPLHWASELGNIDALMMLLDNGSKRTATNNAGSTPLHQAAKSGHILATKLLVQRCSDALFRKSARRHSPPSRSRERPQDRPIDIDWRATYRKYLNWKQPGVDSVASRVIPRACRNGGSHITKRFPC